MLIFFSSICQRAHIVIYLQLNSDAFATKNVLFYEDFTSYGDLFLLSSSTHVQEDSLSQNSWFWRKIELICDAFGDFVPLQAEPATLLKVTLFHGCFSRFVNCKNGTKSGNASKFAVEVDP